MRIIETDNARLKRTIGVFAALLCVFLIPMVSLAAGPDTSGGSRFVTDLAFYAGAFSTAVSFRHPFRHHGSPGHFRLHRECRNILP